MYIRAVQLFTVLNSTVLQIVMASVGEVCSSIRPRVSFRCSWGESGIADCMNATIAVAVIQGFAEEADMFGVISISSGLAGHASDKKHPSASLL